jgi:hypothetical protein
MDARYWRQQVSKFEELQQAQSLVSYIGLEPCRSHDIRLAADVRQFID